MRSIVLTANLLSFNTKQRSSSLLRLPAELRNRIYELVFDSTSLRVTNPPLKIELSNVTRHRRCRTITTFRLSQYLALHLPELKDSAY